MTSDTLSDVLKSRIECHIYKMMSLGRSVKESTKIEKSKVVYWSVEIIFIFCFKIFFTFSKLLTGSVNDCYYQKKYILSFSILKNSFKEAGFNLEHKGTLSDRVTFRWVDHSKGEIAHLSRTTLQERRPQVKIFLKGFSKIWGDYRAPSNSETDMWNRKY